MAAEAHRRADPALPPAAAHSSHAFELTPDGAGVTVTATAATEAQTGVEMEALTAVSTALLTLYDMAKALDRKMVIGEIRLLAKKGGKSGDWSA